MSRFKQYSLRALCTNAVTMAQELVRFESAPVQLGQLQRRLAQERGETLKAASDTIEGYLSKALRFRLPPLPLFGIANLGRTG